MGFEESVQVPGIAIVNEYEDVWVMPPPVAVIVEEYEPALAEAATDKVNMLELAFAPVRSGGANEAVTPAGKPEIARATEELKPF